MLIEQKQKEKEARQQRDAERRSRLFGEPNKEDENQEEEEDNQEEEDNDIEQPQGNGGGFLKKFSIKTILSSLTTFGGSMAVGLAMIGMYRIHYTGEFEFKGISGEYQNESYLMQNFTVFLCVVVLNRNELKCQAFFFFSVKLWPEDKNAPSV